MFAKPSTATDAADPRWAWAPYRPGAARPWNLKLAGHLYRRAAFGATWSELEQALADGPQRTIDKLLEPTADVDTFNRGYDEFEKGVGDSADTIRAWWLRRMIHTPHPLLENMTLFWHGHFGTSNGEVDHGSLMRRHVAQLRENGLGHFDQLLQAVAHDPAVLMALDSNANRKSQSNQRYARALMEVFSLGPGNFSDEDIEETARAFTGWFVRRGKLRFVAHAHDAGVKRILGQEGKFKSDDVVRIVLQQPATPRRIVGKLYRWLISETEAPAEQLLEPLAESFATDYDIARLVGTLLRSNLFFSPTAYRHRVKSPVDFALGVIRPLEGTVSTVHLAQDLAALGQNLYHPPTVKGWPGGRHWITPSTLVGRANLALALLGSGKRYARKLDPQLVARRHGFPTPPAAADFLVDLFLQGDVNDTVRRVVLGRFTPNGDQAAPLRQVAHAVLTLPEYQLS